MKHWKRFLSVFICLLFMLSAIGASATFSDQDQIQNTEAVDVCVSLNIIGGYPDGFYRPDQEGHPRTDVQNDLSAV